MYYVIIFNSLSDVLYHDYESFQFLFYNVHLLILHTNGMNNTMWYYGRKDSATRVLSSSLTSWYTKSIG